MRTLLLIRHAKAVDREQWSGPDADRPFAAVGIRQAHRLAGQLADAGINRVLSSPAVRCVQTVKPLADGLELPVEIDPSLMEGEAIVLPKWRGVLALCAHGDNIPALLRELGLDDHPCRKGSVWEVAWDSSGRKPGAARYREM